MPPPHLVFFIDCASCFSSPLQVLGCVTGLQEWWDSETQLFCGCEAVVLGRVYSINKRPAIEYTRQGQGQLSFSHFFFFSDWGITFRVLDAQRCKANMYHVKQKALALQPWGLWFLRHKVSLGLLSLSRLSGQEKLEAPAPPPMCVHSELACPPAIPLSPPPAFL